MASGDHSYNLILNGIYEIDTFDSNVLTEYYALGIKRAMILAFDFKGYLEFFNKILSKETTLNELTELISSLLPYMEEKHKTYWQEIIAYNYKLQKNNKSSLNLFEMLLISTKYALINTYKNSYLINEKNYNILRNSIINANITFKHCDCLELPNSFNNEYDFIFLSNIADYFCKRFGYSWGYEKLQEIKLKFNSLLKENGIIALAYLFGAYSAISDTYKKELIFSSGISSTDLTDEEIINFEAILNNKPVKNVKDGLILKRK
ncbi:MAG: class I SAM-dependent methyltransferase [Firmicutes bacterium]|nr:class I SAM-dependent methyltransferase [Bacillota bacterium]